MAPPPVDIKKVIGVDSQVINFGTFVCGKILGSTLVVSNLTQSEQIVEVSIDGLMNDYQCKEIFSPYEPGELPFTSDEEKITNSELSHGCWFIENPICKELYKKLTVRLSANAEQELIIVIKAP